MRRSQLVQFKLILIAMTVLALVSFPVAARTSQLLNTNEAAIECPDAGAETGDHAGTATKPAALKRNVAPAAGKARPGTRAADAPPGRAPRWHRFLPGMFR